MTSKPDLYPLVFTYNADNGKNGASYLMVQYFRNYIVRPSGSLSATSTIDSLSSSYICTANEANILVPPPYSRAASPDIPVATNIGHEIRDISRSASQQGCSVGYFTYRPIPAVFAVSDDDVSSHNAQRQPQHSTSNHNTNNQHGYSQLYCYGVQDTAAGTAKVHATNVKWPLGHLRTSGSVNFERMNCGKMNNAHDSMMDMIFSNSEEQIRCNANSCTNLNLNTILNEWTITNHPTQISGGSVSHLPKGDEASCVDVEGHTRIASMQAKDYSGSSSRRDSISISAADSSEARLPHAQQFSEESPVINEDVLKKYGSTRSYMNSMTGSAVSSLTNIDFSTSPPQATSPTGEVKELLEQIRQLQKENNTEGIEDTAGVHRTIDGRYAVEYSYNSAQYLAEQQPLKMTSVTTASKRPSSLQQHLQQRKSGHAKYFPVFATRSICSPISANSWLSFGRNHKRWVSKSAPSTPDTGILPGFLQDHSPLLDEHEEDTEQST